MSQPFSTPVTTGTPPICSAESVVQAARNDRRHRLRRLATERRRSLLGFLAQLIANSIVRAGTSPRKGPSDAKQSS